MLSVAMGFTGRWFFCYSLFELLLRFVSFLAARERVKQIRLYLISFYPRNKCWLREWLQQAKGLKGLNSRWGTSLLFSVNKFQLNLIFIRLSLYFLNMRFALRCFLLFNHLFPWVFIIFCKSFFTGNEFLHSSPELAGISEPIQSGVLENVKTTSNQPLFDKM